jgi:methionine-rich copper-binding protein CopC
MPATRRALGACLVLLAAAAAGPAAGHARLVAAAPAAEAVLAEPPAEIRLRFSEPVAAQLAEVAVIGPDGAEAFAARGAAAGDPAEVVVALPAPLPPGRYLLRWRAVSADLHPVEGAHGFEVAP